MSSNGLLQQQIEEALKVSRSNKKTDYSQHTIGALIGIAITIVIGLGAYHFLFADKIYNLKTGEALSLAYSEEYRLPAHLSNVRNTEQ